MLGSARAVRLSYTSLAFDARLGERRHELFAELRKQLAGLLFALPLATCILFCVVVYGWL